jgi:5-methylthioadenosine/S-adenosylhomocysteine deaminase
MYLSGGVAPIPDMLKRGVTVGLGLDGPASNNGQDMMFCLKATVLMHKVHSLNPTIMSAEKVLEMATIDGARAIGKEDQLGSIERGKTADLILLNPWMANMMPIHRLESQVVYCGKAENIDTVMIDGKIVLQDRKLLTIDENQVLRKAQKLVDEQVERAGEIPQIERRRKWKR